MTDSLGDNLSGILQQAKDALDAAQKPADLEALRVQYLGKKGELTSQLKHCLLYTSPSPRDS